MQKLTDAQKHAIALMRKLGTATNPRSYENLWYVYKNGIGGEIPSLTMQALKNIGLIKIDGDTATLTEGADQDG